MPEGLGIVVRTRQMQGALLALAVCWATVAVGIHLARDTESLLRGFWPWYFAWCALLTALYAVFLTRPLFLLSGFFVPAGFLGRVLATYDRWDKGLTDFGRVVTAFGLYGSLALLTAIVWLFVFGPVSRLRR